MALTWQNVNAPEFSTALGALSLAGKDIGQATADASGALAAFRGWQQDTTDNAVAQRVASFQDPAKLQAALADGSFFSGMDASLARPAAIQGAGTQVSNLLTQATSQQALSTAKAIDPFKIDAAQFLAPQAKATVDQTVASTGLAQAQTRGADATAAHTLQQTGQEKTNFDQGQLARPGLNNMFGLDPNTPTTMIPQLAPVLPQIANSQAQTAIAANEAGQRSLVNSEKQDDVQADLRAQALVQEFAGQITNSNDYRALRENVINKEDPRVRAKFDARIAADPLASKASQAPVIDPTAESPVYKPSSVDSYRYGTGGANQERLNQISTGLLDRVAKGYGIAPAGGGPAPSPAASALANSTAPVGTLAAPLPAESSARQSILRDKLAADLHLTPAQAAGVVSNLMSESGLQAINEVHPLKPGTRGGFGWMQWTGPRRVEFEEWAQKNNLSVTSDQANYGFMIHELTTKYPQVLSRVRLAGTSEQAANTFFTGAESGGDPRVKIGNRVANASSIANLPRVGPALNAAVAGAPPVPTSGQAPVATQTPAPGGSPAPQVQAQPQAAAVVPVTGGPTPEELGAALTAASRRASGVPSPSLSPTALVVPPSNVAAAPPVSTNPAAVAPAISAPARVVPAVGLPFTAARGVQQGFDTVIPNPFPTNVAQTPAAPAPTVAATPAVQPTPVPAPVTPAAANPGTVAPQSNSAHAPAPASPQAAEASAIALPDLSNASSENRIETMKKFSSAWNKAVNETVTGLGNRARQNIAGNPSEYIQQFRSNPLTDTSLQATTPAVAAATGAEAPVVANGVVTARGPSGKTVSWAAGAPTGEIAEAIGNAYHINPGDIAEEIENLKGAKTGKDKQGNRITESELGAIVLHNLSSNSWLWRHAPGTADLGVNSRNNLTDVENLRNNKVDTVLQANREMAQQAAVVDGLQKKQADLVNHYLDIATHNPALLNKLTPSGVTMEQSLRAGINRSSLLLQQTLASVKHRPDWRENRGGKDDAPLIIPPKTNPVDDMPQMNPSMLGLPSWLAN